VPQTALSKRYIFVLVSVQFSLSVNFQHNPNLPQMDITARGPKVSRVKQEIDARRFEGK
jgi:hypothetical protein